MKLVPALLGFAAVLSLASVAKADDFQMVVIDPSPSNYITPITSDAFTFTFGRCHSPQQVPVNSGYDGCFTGQNDTGQTLTSLQLEIPAIVGQTAGCSLFGGGLDIFTSVTCGENPNGSYFLDFSGGNIASNPTRCGQLSPHHDDNGPDGDNDWDDLCTTGIFTIAEKGVDHRSFPEVDTVANVVTPEPAPALLLSTGLLGGLLLGNKRRRALAMQRR